MKLVWYAKRWYVYGDTIVMGFGTHTECIMHNIILLFKFKYHIIAVYVVSNLKRIWAVCVVGMAICHLPMGCSKEICNVEFGWDKTHSIILLLLSSSISSSSSYYQHLRASSPSPSVAHTLFSLLNIDWILCKLEWMMPMVREIVSEQRPVIALRWYHFFLSSQVVPEQHCIRLIAGGDLTTEIHLNSFLFNLPRATFSIV